MPIRGNWPVSTNMVLDGSTTLLVTACLAAAIGYILATWKAVRPAALLAKFAASTSFVTLAFVNGALQTLYGRAILIALALSWIGDMLLLSRESTYLLAGIAAFLMAHIAFAAAFAISGIDVTVFGISAVSTAVLAALILKWLSKYLRGPCRIAVPLYLVAVIAMVSLAVTASIVALPQTVGIAAFAFAVSDISVARDRFIERDVVNKAWGLPLYYLAQLLFAASVTAAG